MATSEERKEDLRRYVRRKLDLCGKGDLVTFAKWEIDILVEMLKEGETEHGRAE